MMKIIINLNFGYIINWFNYVINTLIIINKGLILSISNIFKLLKIFIVITTGIILYVYLFVIFWGGRGLKLWDGRGWGWGCLTAPSHSPIAPSPPSAPCAGAAPAQQRGRGSPRRAPAPFFNYVYNWSYIYAIFS